MQENAPERPDFKIKLPGHVANRFQAALYKEVLYRVQHERRQQPAEV